MILNIGQIEKFIDVSMRTKLQQARYSSHLPPPFLNARQ
jgi:hypothetical protein